MSGKINGKPTCPKCGTVNDGYTGVNGAERPDDGSVMMCAYCQTFAFFRERDGDVWFEECPPDVVEELLADPAIHAAYEITRDAGLKPGV